MERWYGKWKIISPKLESADFLGELCVYENEPSHIEIFKEGNTFNDEIYSFLDENENYTVIGTSQNVVITCLNCYTASYFIDVIIDDGKGRYTKKRNPLDNNKLEILVNKIVFGLEIHDELDEKIKKIQFTNDILSEWIDLLVPIKVIDKEEKDYDIYKIYNKPKKINIFLSDENINT